MVLYKVLFFLSICFAIVKCEEKATQDKTKIISSVTTKNSSKEHYNVVGTEGGTMKNTLLNLLGGDTNKSYPEKKTVPRKGVGNFNDTNSSNAPSTKIIVSQQSATKSNISVTHLNKPNNSTKTKVIKPTMKHVKKPLLLSAEQLESQDSIKQFPSLSPSVHSSMTDQMPAPNEEADMSFASRNPNMVLPLVITILVVPVFAIFGFMAVKKGQEAWRNRHYKRMDFLLDGMYNE